MRRITFPVLLTPALALLADVATGQNITVQQPALGRFSVGTTVVVPDRGRAFLGGVSRAADGRKSFGPFVRGSSIGTERQHSGISSSVYIHDLREMDRRLLQNGRADPGWVRRPARIQRADPGWVRRPAHLQRGEVAGKRLSGYAAHAYRGLTNRTTGSSARRSQRAAPAREFPRRTSDRGAMYLRFARQAEAAGNAAKARELYKIAARHGATTSRSTLRRSTGRTTRR